MTTETADARFQPRLPAEIVADQLQGIAAWHAARREAEQVVTDASSQASREMRLDLDRRRDVIVRQHEAIVQRLDEQLRTGGRLARTLSVPRAVVVHRNEWFRGKVVDGLTSGGVEVVALLENGADAVGVVVAEQPDLLLVEDKLPMISGAEVIRQAARFAPRTLVAAHVSHELAAAAALEDGAAAAYTRRVPPLDVADALCRLVTG